ncbi:MAG: PQQ-binding-like beta-propeller repeat protein [Planctomycetota bacterium JB042]
MNRIPFGARPRAVLATLSLLPLLTGDPWSRFRGPNGEGVAEASLPAALSKEENLRWRTEVPPGYSSPVLTDDAIFLTAADGVALLTICLDRETGEERWRRAAPKELESPHAGVNSPVSPTPATDGENVFVFFERFGLVSYDAAGEERWRREMGPYKTPYGLAASPILVDDRLVLLCDQDVDSFLLAVDAATGEERWRTPRVGVTHGFSTPIVRTADDGTRELIVSGSYEVAGYDAATGARRWWVTGMAWQAKSVPVLDGDVLYVHSWMAAPSELGVPKVTMEWSEARETYDADEGGTLSRAEAKDLGIVPVWFLYDLDKSGELDATEWAFVRARSFAESGLYAIRLGGEGDLTEDAILWRAKRSLPNIPSPLLHGGFLYLLKEGGILSALDPADGSTAKSERVEGTGYFASPVAAGDRLLLASHEGTLTVLSAGADFEVVSVGELEEEIWATPAISGRHVFVRTQRALYCFEDRSF